MGRVKNVDCHVEFTDCYTPTPLVYACGNQNARDIKEVGSVNMDV